MSARNNLDFEYKGESYSVKYNQMFDVAEKIEEFIPFENIQESIQKLHKLLRAFDVVLKSVGVKEDLQDIKTEFLTNPECSGIVSKVIMAIIIPIAQAPEAVSKHAPKKQAATKRKAKKA